MEKYNVYEPVFRECLTLYIGEFSDFQKDVQRVFGCSIEDDCYDGEMLTLENNEGDKVFLVWVNQYDGSPLWTSTLVHELNHAATVILDRKGVPVTKENTEVLAYYQGFLVEKFLEQIEKRRKNRKKRARKK